MKVSFNNIDNNNKKTLIQRFDLKAQSANKNGTEIQLFYNLDNNVLVSINEIKDNKDR